MASLKDVHMCFEGQWIYWQVFSRTGRFSLFEGLAADLGFVRWGLPWTDIAISDGLSFSVRECRLFCVTSAVVCECWPDWGHTDTKLLKLLSSTVLCFCSFWYVTSVGWHDTTSWFILWAVTRLESPQLKADVLTWQWLILKRSARCGPKSDTAEQMRLIGYACYYIKYNHPAMHMISLWSCLVAKETRCSQPSQFLQVAGRSSLLCTNNTSMHTDCDTDVQHGGRSLTYALVTWTHLTPSITCRFSNAICQVSDAVTRCGPCTVAPWNSTTLHHLMLIKSDNTW